VELVTDGSKGMGILPGELVKGTLRTGANSRATLLADDGTRLELADSTRATVQTADGAVRLDSGRIVAQMGSRPLKLTAGSSAVMVEGSTGQFEVAVTPGSVEVISRKGALNVHSGDKVVAVADGTRMTFGESGPVGSDKASAGDAPQGPAKDSAPDADAKAAAAPTPAPEPKPLVLKVSWPAAPVKSTSYTLKGTTTPGATVKVNGADATVKSNGKFSASVELPEGESVVEVKATGPNGEDKADSQKITVAAKAEAADDAPAAKDAAKPADQQAPATEDAKADSTPDDGQAKPKKKAAKSKVKEEASGWE
jgi:ferric-dicitrate binding protein FerR (iron transport regulator)